jgi:hypothetical protein
MGALNTILGGLGGQQIANRNIGAGLGAIALAPTKDLAIKGIGSLYKLDAAADATAKNLSREAAAPLPENKNWAESIPKEVWMGAGGLGLGALGIAAFNGMRNRALKKRELEQAQKGRVKITLPTKQPGDNETQVEMPLEDLNLSKALHGRLGRDTKRRLYEETRERTRRRKPKNPDKPTDKELEDMELERERDELENDELDKAAALESLVAELHPPLVKRAP